MRLSEELSQAAELLERQQHEFDKEWISGVRKGWQQLYKARKSYPGRAIKSRYKTVSVKRDDKAVRAAAKATKVYLMRVKTFLEHLQQDLLINKGFWHPPTKGIIGQGFLAKEKSTIVKALHNAIKAIEVPRNEYGHREMIGHPWNTHPAFTFVDVEGMDAVLRGLAIRAEEGVQKAHGYLNRGVWKTLNTIIKEYGDGQGADADNSMSVNKGFEPTELRLGKMRLIFADTPTDPKGLSYKKRGKYGKQKWRHPEDRTKVVKLMGQVQGLLRKRKLDHIWYGDVIIYPGAKAYKFKDGKGKLRSAGADYTGATETIRVFGGADRAGVIGTMVHELGHRYHRKVMTQKDRDHFDKWFGEVDATSEYGASKSSEDFAEVFMEYVLGKMKLSRDQIERFESVLQGKIQMLEPATGDVKDDSIMKVYGVPVAFVDVKSSGWAKPLMIIKYAQSYGLKTFRRMWRHGIVVRKPRSGFPMVDYDAKAGVLTLHMKEPVSAATAIKNAGLAFYYSDLVTPKMRAAWQDLWSKRMRVTAEGAAKRFGYELAKELQGRSDPDGADRVTTHMLYWILGNQSEPARVRSQEEPHEIPTPRQMHQKSRMKLPGMEARMGPLSSALTEAVIW